MWSGVAVEIIDGNAARRRLRWSPAQCRVNAAGARCRNRADRAVLVLTFVPDPQGLPVAYRFRVAFDADALEELPAAPLLVRLTFGRTRDRAGTIATCEARPTALVCPPAGLVP